MALGKFVPAKSNFQSEDEMKALTWNGKNDIRCESVPDPRIEHDRDAIIKVTACAICGSDLHLFDGIMPSMEKGDVLGHETMGEVVEVGKGNSKLNVGDRVVVPFTISCGECFFCKNGFFSGCERSNPNAKAAEKMWGHSPAGLFGYSHMLGGFAGGQAQYLRVPYADVGPIKVPEGLTDDQVLFLSDIFPTGYMAADFCNLQGGETVAIWGCGPVGQFAIKSAFLLGAERVIAIDTVPERLALAKAVRRDYARFHAGGYLRPHPGADAGAGRGCLHRRGRHGAGDRIRVRRGRRQDQSGDVHGHGPPPRAEAGNPLLPQFRHGIDRRRLWRASRQHADGQRDQSRPHIPHGADARAALPPEADGAHRKRRHRSFVRYHAPGGARRRA